jgi:cytoskeletal protein CcmA (bactofilin family)
MFSKGKEKLESFIGTNTHFTGDITVKGTLRVDGKVTGNIETDWLILGDKSTLKGNVTATGIIVAGTIEGNLNAKEMVEIKKKGQVKGDIVTNKLMVADGGFVNGKISMLSEETKIIELTKDKFKEAQS